MARPPRARAAVLDAAERVLLRQGAAALTLDAVAAEAGVSKGGLMYHFPAKQALLEALVARAVDDFDAALAQVPDDASPGSFTRAYLRATLTDSDSDPAAPDRHRTATGATTGPESGAGTGTASGTGPVPPTPAGSTALEQPSPATPDLVAALAAAASQDPDVLAPLRAAYQRWQTRLEHDGIPAAAATAVRLAVDGWWLAAMLGLPPLSPEVRAETVTLLLSLAEPVPDRR